MRKELDAIFSGKIASHLFEKQIISETICHKLLEGSEWKVKEYIERTHEIQASLADLCKEALVSLELLWSFIKKEATRLEKKANKMVTLDDKLPIDVDCIKDNITAIFAESSSKSREDILKAINERLEFAVQSTRKNDFFTQVFNQKKLGTIKIHMGSRYLHALNLLERRTDFVDWS